MKDGVVVSTETGISREVMWLSEGIVVPPTRRAFRQVSGVLTAHGETVPHGNNWMANGPLNLPPDRPASPERLTGRHLFAGTLKNHFGHAITEGISRLWAFAEIAPGTVQSILFIPHDPKLPGQIQPLIENIRDLCGLSVPIRMIVAPTQVERLCVPGPGYGLADLATGTPEFRAFFADRFARDIAPGPYRKLYLSRSGLDPLTGGAINEADLEAALEQDGYHVMRPEQHSLLDQTSALKGAECVVGLDGSALHLAALVQAPGQKVGIILRNPIHDRPAATMAAQVRAMGTGKKVHLFNSLRAFHREKNIPRGSRTGLATLDIERTMAALQDHGMVDTLAAHDLRPVDIAATRAFLARQPQEFAEWLY